jgi:hypothetical protein
MTGPNPGAETRTEIQRIQKCITEINAEYAYLMAKRANDGETARKIHRLRVERSALNLRCMSSEGARWPSLSSVHPTQEPSAAPRA